MDAATVSTIIELIDTTLKLNEELYNPELSDKDHWKLYGKCEGLMRLRDELILSNHLEEIRNKPLQDRW